MKNLFQDLKKKWLSTKKFHEIIVKAFFINTTNKNYLNPTLISKMLFHENYQTDHKYIYLLTHLVTGMLVITTTVKLVTVKLLSKNVIGLQEINKANKKHFGGR